MKSNKNGLERLTQKSEDEIFHPAVKATATGALAAYFLPFTVVPFLVGAAAYAGVRMYNKSDKKDKYQF